MSYEHEQPEPIPYASPDMRGPGRTPVQIALCAASHLVLGALILAAAARAFVSAGFSLQAQPVSASFAVATVAGAAMTLAGISLLLKGRAAFTCAIRAFFYLGLIECVAAGWHAHAVVHGLLNSRGVGNAVWWMLAATCLSVMSSVVLRYLGSAKARRTFALHQSLEATTMEWLPTVAAFYAAVLIGLAIRSLS
jgi:hypothetical protein